MNLAHLDAQLAMARHVPETPHLDDHIWASLATTIHHEITTIDEHAINRLRLAMPVPPERYLEELTAFQAWMDFAHINRHNPILVRAQIMTELYVGFVWLRDSVLKPVATILGTTTATATVEHFLAHGTRRRLRNAIAHGRWCYQHDFTGLDCWDGQPPQHFPITHEELGAWQLLSRGTAIAVLLALGTP